MREGQDRGGAALEESNRGVSRHRLLLILTALIVVASDQVTKYLAARHLSSGDRINILGELLGLRLTTNPGGVFGLFPGAGLAFSILTFCVVCIVLWWGLSSGEFPILFGGLAGGGLGNLIDRAIRPPGFPRGQVVDFIDLSFWPTFNLADVAISVSVAILIVRSITDRKQVHTSQT